MTRNEPDDGDFYIAVDLAGFEAEGSVGVKNSRLDNTAMAIVKANEKGWWVAEIVYGQVGCQGNSQEDLRCCQAKYEPVAVGIEKGIAKTGGYALPD